MLLKTHGEVITCSMYYGIVTVSLGGSCLGPVSGHPKDIAKPMTAQRLPVTKQMS